MPTYGRYDVAFVSGNGSTLTDTQGKEYIDFTSGIGVNSVGHANPAWTQAVIKQVLSIAHVSNYYYSPTTVALGKALCEASGFSKAFLGNSGAEANECAFKIARKYSFDKYGDGRGTIISLKNSFHGRTIATVTATGQDVFHQYFHPFAPGFRYAEKSIESVLEQLDETVCAVIMEPIQGEGGVVPIEKEFVEKLSALCKEKDLVLIFDEVQTGVGRTGKLFAWEHYGIRPDVLTTAKGLAGGLPIGACLCTEQFGGVLTAGTHGTTFGGNPAACAGALEVLKQVTAPGFLENVRKNGEMMRAEISKMPNVELVRGEGMMIGIVLKKGDAHEVAQKCLDNGLLVLTAKTLVRLLPPLTTSRAEIEKGLEILRSCLA